MIRVAIVDDRANNRSILSNKLQRTEFFEVAMQAVNGEDFLEQMRSASDQDRPNVVLMDLEMPVMDGVTAIASASSLYPDTRFVVLTIFDDDEKIFKAIKAGACGYLLKEESGPVITEMLMNLWESGAGPISPSIAYKILQMVQQPVKTTKSSKEAAADMFHLSEREKEILQMLSQGLDYREIATKISISPNTVKKHTINIYQKLHVNSKAQALRIAYTKGLI